MYYKIPVQWTTLATVHIEANSKEEAIRIAYDAPLPPENERDYGEDSFAVDKEGIEEVE